MYLLDTNVVSELRRRRPHGGVLAWIESVPDTAVHLSAVTLGELQAGVEMTRQADPGKAAEIERWLDQIAATINVIAMDGSIFRVWEKFMNGQSDDLIEDAMIAATASVLGFIVVKRNGRDFATFGLKTLDPFKTAR